MSFSNKPKTSLPLLTTENQAVKSRGSETDLSSGSVNLLEKHKGLLTTLWQWGVLIVSLIGGAAVGLFYFYVQIECQLLKSAWRLLALVFAMIPLVYFEYRKEKDSFLYSKENLLNIKSWIKMFWASAGHSIWTVATLISVNYTSVAQSFVFLNLHSIIIVGYTYLQGNPVSRFEIVGSLLATKGTIFLAFDDEIESKEGMVDLSLVSFWDRIIFGDLVGILGSVGACLYFVKNRELKNDFPLYLGIMVMTVMGWLQISVASFILEEPTFSFDPMNGMFGLFTQEWFVTYIYIILVTGYGAYVAYVLALKYFDALLVSIFLTLEPVAGALMVFLLGWQSFPGPLTILGFLFILPGIVVVTVGKSKRKEQEQQLAKQSDNKMQVPLLNVS